MLRVVEGPLRVASVNGSLSRSSKTGLLVDLVLEELRDRVPVEHHRVDIADLDAGFSTARSREDLPEGILHRFEQVEQSDLLLAATPVFRGSYSGMFKHFFDLVDQYALANKPVMLLATGGSDRHALVIEHELRPLFGFFQAATVPVGIYGSSGDFAAGQILNPEIHARVRTAIDDLRLGLQD